MFLPDDGFPHSTFNQLSASAIVQALGYYKFLKKIIWHYLSTSPEVCLRGVLIYLQSKSFPLR